jgi:hypothetical protein
MVLFLSFVFLTSINSLQQVPGERLLPRKNPCPFRLSDLKEIKQDLGSFTDDPD